MPITFPIDHVLNRSIRLLNEIRITRGLRDLRFVQVQILEIEIEDLLQQTQPHPSSVEYYHEYDNMNDINFNLNKTHRLNFIWCWIVN